MKQQIRSLQDGYQAQLTVLAGVIVTVEQPIEACPLCEGPMHVQKTVPRQAMTLAHGVFRVREAVHVCDAQCKKQGRLVTRRSETLAELIPPKSTVGYGVMVHLGLERFIHHRQREEIRTTLAKDGIPLSSGEISELGKRFLIYLEALHEASAPALRSAMDNDGGWPLHIDATGEGGRGTLLAAFSGWRKWVLGSWKVPTENADAILPRLQETVTRFGPPRAIMRDLGRAMKDAADQLVKTLDRPIPILATGSSCDRKPGRETDGSR